MENSIYQVQIECDDDLTLIIYLDDAPNKEQELLDKFYLMYLWEQSDITKYKVTDITKQRPTLKSNLDKSSATLHLALKGLEYAEKYNN
jgi:hypothetical protein